jgi:hypothetical protein
MLTWPRRSRRGRDARLAVAGQCSGRRSPSSRRIWYASRSALRSRDPTHAERPFSAYARIPARSLFTERWSDRRGCLPSQPRGRSASRRPCGHSPGSARRWPPTLARNSRWQSHSTTSACRPSFSRSPPWQVFFDRAAAHCAQTGADPDDFVETRFIADMAPSHFQIEAAWHHAVWGVEAVRTGGFTPPPLVGPVPFAAAAGDDREGPDGAGGVRSRRDRRLRDQGPEAPRRHVEDAGLPGRSPEQPPVPDGEATPPRCRAIGGGACPGENPPR